MSRFLFVVDAGQEIGGGHVMRSLSLAEALAEKGADCVFVTTPSVAGILDTFDRAGMGRISIIDRAPQALVETAAMQGAAWGGEGNLVIDHYGIDAAAEQTARACFARITVIDDLANRPHLADALVDPGIGRIGTSYSELVPPKCRLLIGPSYALLRPQFAEARAEALLNRDPGRGVRRALISLGLTDVRRITRRVVEGVVDAAGAVELLVLISSRSEGRADLERLAAANANIVLHLDAIEVARLMSEADVAVGAGGSSAWERACLGLPSITVTLAQNQESTTAELARRGVTLLLDESSPGFEQELLRGWRTLLTSAETRAELSANSAALCDGLGAKRVADALLQSA